MNENTFVKKKWSSESMLQQNRHRITLEYRKTAHWGSRFAHHQPYADEGIQPIAANRTGRIRRYDRLKPVPALNMQEKNRYMVNAAL
jgi:hypothetical protein